MKDFILMLWMVGVFFVAAYVALGYGLVGGVVQLIHAAQAAPVNAYGVAFGLARVLCTKFIFSAVFILMAFPAAAFLSAGPRTAFFAKFQS